MSIAVDFATARDDAGIRRLVAEEAMPGRVRIAFCREPEFSTGCAVTGEDVRILVARTEPEGHIVGVACRSVRHVFINGREHRIGYLGQLRVDTRWRGRWLVSRGFAALERLHRTDPLPAYLASIVDQNHEANAVLIDRRRRGFPVFREAARYVTAAIRVGARSGALRPAVDLTHGSAAEFDELSRFLTAEATRRQLSSVWTADSLRRLGAYGLRPDDVRIARRHGDIAGVIALWDQSAYKQSVIHSYTGWLRCVAPMLPRPGARLRSAYAALIAIANDDLEVFSALLEEVCRTAALRGFEYLLVGLDMRDPLLKAVRAYRHVAYGSRLHLASWDRGGSGYEQLDARPVYVDIATL